MPSKPITTIDIERPIYRAGMAVEVAGIKSIDNLAMLRKREGLKIGSIRGGEYRYSILDNAELTAYPALTALGFTSAEAIETCREVLRPSLKDLLNNRLVHGFWSMGGLEVEPAKDFTAPLILYLDGIGERVITKLNLPLPVCREMPPTKIALAMVDAIFEYIYSPPGRARWVKWHAQAMTTPDQMANFADAAAVLGAPEWFLRILIPLLSGGGKQVFEPSVDPIVINAIRPRAPKVAEVFLR
jgi:hypothetical protein